MALRHAPHRRPTSVRSIWRHRGNRTLLTSLAAGIQVQRSKLYDYNHSVKGDLVQITSYYIRVKYVYSGYDLRWGYDCSPTCGISQFLYLRNGDKLQLQRASPALYLASHIPSRFLGK
jgi:hypothetical protein